MASGLVTASDVWQLHGHDRVPRLVGIGNSQAGVRLNGVLSHIRLHGAHIQLPKSVSSCFPDAMRPEVDCILLAEKPCQEEVWQGRALR